MKKRTHIARVGGLFGLLFSLFSCELHVNVDPMPDYEAILTSHRWVVTGAVYHQPQNLSDRMLSPLKNYLDIRRFDCTRVTDVYGLLQESFPCVLDNTFAFDKATHTLTMNTGYQPCVGAEPFTNYLLYNEFPHDDLSENDGYTVSFLPTGSRSIWSISPDKRELYIRENPGKRFPEYSSAVWRINAASPDQMVVETGFYFGYSFKDSYSYREHFQGAYITLTLRPER